ncbi:MAG: putative Ig domain-containing protein, partial [Planctomycetota bacterium]
MPRRLNSGPRNRFHHIEALEKRELLAAAIWHNANHSLNVSGDVDGLVSPLDALMVIQHLANQTRDGSTDLTLQSQVDGDGHGPYVDVNCDGIVSATDALAVINGLSQQQRGTPLAQPKPGGAGVHPGAGCAPLISEAGGLVNELNHYLTIPANENTLRVVFQAPTFSSAAGPSGAENPTGQPNRIPDALEILLTLPDGQSVPILNWTEGAAAQPLAGAAISKTGQEGSSPSEASPESLETWSISVGLQQLPAGAPLILTSRLIGNGDQHVSTVRVLGSEFTDALAAPIAPDQIDSVTGVASGLSLPTLTKSEDLSASTDVQFVTTRFDAGAGELVTEVQIQPSPDVDLPERVVLALDAADPTGVSTSLAEFDGLLSDGRPYLDVTQAFLDAKPADRETHSPVSVSLRLLVDESFDGELPLQVLGHAAADVTSGVGFGGALSGESSGNVTLLDTSYLSFAIPTWAFNSDHTKMLVDDSDIVALHRFSDGSWRYEMYFDGSDVGLWNYCEDVDAFTIREDGSILISTHSLSNLPDLGYVWGQDVLLFEPTSLGQHTAGAWSMYVDGSDLGFSNWENIDALHELPDGRLIVSSKNRAKINGFLSKFHDKDLVALDLQQTGWQTRASASFYFDGSDVGLGTRSEDIKGLSLSDDGTTIEFSPLWKTFVPGLRAFGRDVLTLDTTSLGWSTEGTYRTPLTIKGKEVGLWIAPIDGLHRGDFGGNENQAPTLDEIENQTVDEGSTLSVFASADDDGLPGASLVYSLDNAPAGAIIDAQTGEISWTTDESDGPGTFDFTVSVSDGELSDTDLFSVTVDEVNQAPVLQSIDDQTITVDG